MSRNDWEVGTIKLPTAEFARVRQTVADAQTKESEAIYSVAQEFWDGLSGKQRSDYGPYRDASRYFARVSGRPSRPVPAGFEDAVNPYWGEKPKRIKKSDLPFPTNRDLSFTVGVEGEIVFDREASTVSWGTGDNNHAVDRARSTTIARALFQALGTVKWSRDTGGILTGNDEYNQDNRENGGGGNYVTHGFGPRGAAEAPGKTGDYVTSDGKRVRRGDFDAVQKAAQASDRRAWARRLKGAPGSTGGQFASHHHSLPEARL